MKKLIAFSFAVVAAVAANAASFQWSATNIGKVGDATSAGLTAYLVDASKVDRATMIAALSTGDFQYMKNENYLLTTTTLAQGTTGMSRINTTSGTASSSITSYSAYTIVLDGAVGSAKNFLATAQISNATNPGYDSGNGPGLGNVQFTFGQQTSTAWTPTSSIPEPTSGLLMLVGLGALALRRRKA